MSEDKDKKEIGVNLNVNVPELKPVADALKNASDETVSGLKGFMASICSPVASQIGGLLADKVKCWRYSNILRFSAKAKALHEQLDINPSYEVHPRMMLEIIDGVSKQQDDDLLDWWAGLTVSSCEECPTDKDLIFTNLMGQITCLQKKIIEFSCSNAKVEHTLRGLLVAQKLILTGEEVIKIAGIEDINTIDRELDSLRNHGLIAVGFNLHKSKLDADITPSALALHFYARCNGVTEDLKEYYSTSEMLVCPNCGGTHD